MTQVTFHVNTPDTTAYACRLLRKATGLGARVVVTGKAAALERLDVALWSFSALEFVPHCRDNAPHSVLQASPIVIAHDGPGSVNAQVLLHLGGPAPEPVAQFEKLIEVVGTGTAELQEARQRWRQYAQQGHALTLHEVKS
jgi:DNA polymerase-3 subunit chi